MKVSRHIDNFEEKTRFIQLWFNWKIDILYL